MDLISVIIPVYGVEKYLDRCINTIVNQTYKNLEIILVDDGSKDNCPAMCDEWAKKDGRIIVIHKENQGLGLARNSGLSIATGRYVAFIDSDDFVDVEMIEKLYTNLVDKSCDTVYCGFYKYYNEKVVVPVESMYNEVCIENEKIISDVLLNMIATLPDEKKECLLSMSVWHALYSKEIIDEYNISFPSEREFMSEDMIFDIDYLQRAKKIYFFDTPLYYYSCENQNSLTQNYKLEEFSRQIKQVRKMETELNKILPSDDYKLRLQRYLLGRLRTCIMKASRMREKDKNFNFYQHIKELISSDDVVEIMKTYPYKQNPMQLRIYNFCIKYKLILGIGILTRIRNSKKNSRF
ncbi:MAG: glycosyltransferase [Clostridia bacterium]